MKDIIKIFDLTNDKIISHEVGVNEFNPSKFTIFDKNGNIAYEAKKDDKDGFDMWLEGDKFIKVGLKFVL